MTTTPERIHGSRGAGGETTGATDMTTQQPEAIKLAERCEHGYPLTGDAISAAAELRRQHARITELESQLAQRFDAADMATASAQEDALDAVRYRFLRDGEWRDPDLEPFIRLQLNTLWDAKIDAARKQGASHDR